MTIWSRILISQMLGLLSMTFFLPLVMGEPCERGGQQPD
jgi:hypothetical protein